MDFWNRSLSGDTGPSRTVDREIRDSAAGGRVFVLEAGSWHTGSFHLEICRGRPAMRVWMRSAEERKKDMRERKLSHVTVAAILLALLTLPAPVHAATQTRGTVELWDWLTGVWERGIAALAVWDRGTEKAGLGIDPNGEPAPAGAGIDPNGSTSPQGAGIDPNGEPQGHGIDPNG